MHRAAVAAGIAALLVVGLGAAWLAYTLWRTPDRLPTFGPMRPFAIALFVVTALRVLLFAVMAGR
jgi:hypothetical protein